MRRPRLTPITGCCPNTGGQSTAGFTLVELLVAVTIFTIVVALVVVSIAKMFGSSNAGQANRTAKVAMADTIDKLTSDIQRSRAEDRTNSHIRSPETLYDAVALGHDIQSEDPAESGRILMIDDVVGATPTQLDIMADVVTAQAGTECVRWQALASGSGFTVTRSVFADGTPASGCSGAAIGAAKEMLRSSSSPLPAAGVFSYDLVCNTDVCQGRTSPLPTGSPRTPCTSWRSSTPNPTERRWITAVQISLVSGHERGDSGLAQTKGATSVALRTRATAEYKMAAGCA